ncbi:HNH endonuclease [Curtobacterium flaccumfaciens pv. flaccumfaciens]|uniref:HNH endonuclease signature motif containing protein n=1 Tax=Curtobacterium flaccumfaciens TaxID=2035 RepID=UPI00217DBA3A|nr:HNH endonuclease signature motif containing protein [Curtobacterium flaccumfaciens]MCS6570291.1 HNH endonuclease [Curtobacterium flaccumfaciens pv. flaccumfaciens]MCS6585147.1 HNH endonuclease [Curtobacterium flaccumfaciens pv. flaccumfaciens]
MTDIVIVDRRFSRPTVDRFWSKVEKGRDCWLWLGGKRSGYGLFWLGDRHVSAHRLSWLLDGRELPTNLMLDHLCFDRACVNPEHLRVVTNKQNQEHRSGPTVLSTSGYLGVSRTGRRWKAEVRHNGKRHYFGTYPTRAEAAAAVQAGRDALYTHHERMSA